MNIKTQIQIIQLGRMGHFLTVDAIETNNQLGEIPFYFNEKFENKEIKIGATIEFNEVTWKINEISAIILAPSNNPNDVNLVIQVRCERVTS